MNESGFLLEMFFQRVGGIYCHANFFFMLLLFWDQISGRGKCCFFWVEGGKLPQGLPPVEESQD